MTRSFALSRPVSLALAGVISIGAIGLLGSDRWIATGFSHRQGIDVWGAGGLKPVVADEAYWLKSGRQDLTPAVAYVPQKLSFGPLDVLSVNPLPTSLAGAGDTDQPMVLVTVRETTADGFRLVRFIVEAGRAPAVVVPAAKGL